MRKEILLTIMLVLLLSGVATCQQKVGFVNTGRIFEEYSAAKEAQAKYQKEIEELNRQVTEREERIQALADTIEANKYLFSEERLRQKRKELEKLQQEYLKFRQDAELQAARRNDELTRPIIEAIEQATKEVAEKENFDLILDSGGVIVIYSKPELDLTDKVLQKLEEMRGSTE